MTGPDAIEFLTRFYGRRVSLTPDAKKYFTETLEDMPYSYRSLVIKRVVEDSRHFPTVKELRTAYRAIRQETQSAETRKSPAFWPTEAKYTCNPNHAKASFALIEDLRRNPRSPEERAKLFDAMHLRFPEFGWDEAAKATREGTEEQAMTRMTAQVEREHPRRNA